MSFPPPVRPPRPASRWLALKYGAPFSESLVAKDHCAGCKKYEECIDLRDQKRLLLVQQGPLPVIVTVNLDGHCMKLLLIITLLFTACENFRGPDGLTGPQGEQGERGRTGQTGPTGLQGEPNIPAGTTYLTTFSDSSDVSSWRKGSSSAGEWSIADGELLLDGRVDSDYMMSARPTRRFSGDLDIRVKTRWIERSGSSGVGIHG